MNKKDYRKYLLTPEWKQRRVFVLERDGRACVLCGSVDELQVHHRTYERRGDELLSDLTTLCAECHAKHHGKDEFALSAELKKDLVKMHDMLRANISNAEAEINNTHNNFFQFMHIWSELEEMNNKTTEADNE